MTNTKVGLIFDILLLENGIVFTLFKLFRIGVLTDSAKDDEEAYTALVLGLYKAELAISLGWRKKL